MPHVEVRTLGGGVFRYAGIWQRANLVLVAIPAQEADSAYLRGLAARAPAFRARGAACVVTCDTVVGLPAPGVLVADRWGEIVHVATAAETATLPGVDDLLEWLDYVDRRCPECEGEAK